MFGLLGKLRQVTICGIFHHEHDVVTGTIAWNLRHLERNYTQVLDVLAVKVETIPDEGDEMVHTRTVIPVLQTYHHRTIVGTGT